MDTPSGKDPSPLTEQEVAAWTIAAHDRWARDLTFQELRKSVSAVSDWYVHKRSTENLGDRATDGRGKRAAFVVYFGSLHLLLVQAWLAERPPVRASAVVDLGCGPGVVGAAVARWCGASRVWSSDRLGAHLEVAAWTGRALGVKLQTRKAALPSAVPSIREPTLLTLGWVLNELDDETRAHTIVQLRRAMADGAGVLVFAPLSTRATPWWSNVVAQLTEATPDAEEGIFRCRPVRPPLIVDLDRATRLDHREMGARYLFVAPRPRSG